MKRVKSLKLTWRDKCDILRKSDRKQGARIFHLEGQTLFTNEYEGEDFI